MTIDVGSPAIDRPSSSLTRTLVDRNNLANATGIITEINLYSKSALEGIQVASFFLVSGTTLSTRGYASLANQGGTGLKTYTAPTDFTPFEIRASDYIGIYFTAGQIDYGSGVGFGIYYKLGDQIPCTSEEFILESERMLSLNATGVQLGQIAIGGESREQKVIQNVLIAIGGGSRAWKQITVGSNINIGDVWKEILH